LSKQSFSCNAKTYLKYEKWMLTNEIKEKKLFIKKKEGTRRKTREVLEKLLTVIFIEEGDIKTS
jgi:hypothetical protein